MQVFHQLRSIPSRDRAHAVASVTSTVYTVFTVLF